MTDKNENQVVILGKKINSTQNVALISVYLIFLSFIWPLIAGSYWLVSTIICFVPVLVANFFYELFGSIKFYRKIIYTLIFISTFIYTYFFLNNNFIINIFHYTFNLFFGYIISRKAYFNEKSGL